MTAEELARVLRGQVAPQHGPPPWIAEAMTGLERGHTGAWYDEAGRQWLAQRSAAGHLEVCFITRWHVVPDGPAPAPAPAWALERAGSGTTGPAETMRLLLRYDHWPVP